LAGFYIPGLDAPSRLKGGDLDKNGCLLGGDLDFKHFKMSIVDAWCLFQITVLIKQTAKTFFLLFML